jgi:hypothetical protein
MEKPTCHTMDIYSRIFRLDGLSIIQKVEVVPYFTMLAKILKTMTGRIILTLLVLLTELTLSQGQQLFESIGYSNGLYKTKEDFISKQPLEVSQLLIKKIELINDTDSIIRRCYFIDKETNKRIKKTFAVVYNGDVYFSNWAILKYKNKDDKSLSPASSMNAFVLVTIFGEKYLYAEAGLVNHWQVGISSGVAGGVGGIVGSELGKAVDKSYPSTTQFGTGIVWDIKNKEFNIFRNCPDFNEFIEIYSIEKIDCKNGVFDLNRVREIVQIINSSN